MLFEHQITINIILSKNIKVKDKSFTKYYKSREVSDLQNFKYLCKLNKFGITY